MINITKLKDKLYLLKSLGVTSFIVIVLSRVFASNMALQNKKHKVIKNYIKNKYSYLFQQYRNSTPNIEIKEFNIRRIWVFWWQGRENAPDLVKKCILSIERHAVDAEVICLDKDNYQQYVNLPPYIIEKRYNKKITLTHFSDILRMSLLSQYGGIWMDATMFAIKDIPEWIYKTEFYTSKVDLKRPCPSVSNYRWSGFFMGGNKNMLFEFHKNLMLEYWKNESRLIDYFLIDYIIECAYEEFIFVQRILDQLPYNNLHVHDFGRLLKNEYNEIEFEYLQQDTFAFKLSYKIPINRSDKNSHMTYYDFIINN